MKIRIIALFLCIFMLSGVLALSPVIATDVDPELEIAACNLAFEDTVYIKYAVSAKSLEGIKLLLWTSPQTEYTYGSQNAVLTPERTEAIQGKEMLVFKYTRLAAKQMTDVVYARAFVENSGTYYYSNIQKYSVIQYVYNKTGKTGEASPNPKLITLLNSMLVYGSDAQKYFEYKTDRLAIDDFYQVVVENGLIDDLCDKGLYLPGDSVSLVAEEVNAENVAFSGWQNSAGIIVATTPKTTVTVGTKNEKYTAVYGAAAASPLEFDSNGDGTCVVVGLLEHESTDIVIPQYSPDGDLVVGIDSNAFSGTDITSIKIPVSVEEIGRRAFNNCNDLTDVFYDGSKEQWEEISISSGNTALEDAIIHYATDSFVVDEPGLYCLNVTGEKGTTISLPISLLGCSDPIAAMAISVSADSDIFTVTNGTWSNKYEYFMATFDVNKSQGAAKLKDQVVVNGEVLNLSIEISEAASSGTYTITITPVKITYFDSNEDEQSIECQSSVVSITIV